MSDFLKLVGARLREVRKQKNLSQADLAEMAGTQDTYIGGVERGERNISLNTLERITDSLGITIEEVFQFGHIRQLEGLNEKHLIIAIIQSKLQERSMSEVMLVQRIVDDLFNTIDEQNQSK
ncbi:HTH-type transcriptional regulator SinR [compost metagenome]